MIVFTFVHMKKLDLNNSRLLTPTMLGVFLKENDLLAALTTIGFSAQGKPIYSYHEGNGPFKVLMWSQMHGNESTTTKAMLDFWMYLKTPAASDLLDQCTFVMIPQLNPDGSDAYTRFNANEVDLNRDAIDLSQPESLVLWSVYDQFEPHYCFNLHGQRTVFTAGNTHTPATISFLAPSADQNLTVTAERELAMGLIVSANTKLQKSIPDAVGRYDDSFNINCVGDYFTSLNTPTVLFEAGHFKDDYHRVIARKYVLEAIIAMCNTIASSSIADFNVNSYFEIPENYKNLRDVEIFNIKTSTGGNFKTSANSVFYQFKELKKGADVVFIPEIELFDEGLKGLLKIDAQQHDALKDIVLDPLNPDYENLTKTISLLIYV
ncbi:MAG: hypothetical protein ACI94N_000023 [Candidatus Arcticimaribacter sp.]|jgi:hypothetical protein